MLARQKVSVLPLTRREIDVSDSAQVDRVLGTLAADVMISTTAFHKVEECPKQPAQSFAANSVGPRNFGLLPLSGMLREANIQIAAFRDPS